MFISRFYTAIQRLGSCSRYLLYPRTIGVSNITLIKPNVRNFALEAPLTKPMVEDRVMLVLKLYDKIDHSKLSLDARFVEDFGLDSLDHVELVMAIEEEFIFEIPDWAALRFKTPRDIIRYVCDKHDLYD